VDGKSLVDKTVAFAILRTAIQLVTENNVWSVSQRRRLFEEFVRIDSDDPFGGEAGLAWEEELALREGRRVDEQTFHQVKQLTVNELFVVMRLLESR